MTNQEAIKILEEVSLIDDSIYQYNKKYLEALDMAIQALKNEQTERKFEKVVVNYLPAEILCTYPEYKDKPYFSIQYEEKGKHIIGFGTYNSEVLSEYIREYFLNQESEEK